MMTTTHILMGAAISAKPGFKPYQIALAWLGGFAPDVSIFGMVAFSRFAGTTGAGLWARPNGLYWQEPWQFFSALSNSIPMWIMLCLLGWFLYRRGAGLRTVGLGVLIFSSAASMHVILDFITHASDAHVHFWPFADWRFFSPISYYDPAFFGRIVGVFEVATGLIIIAYLVRSSHFRVVKILAVLMGLPYFLVLFFAFRGGIS